MNKRPPLIVSGLIFSLFGMVHLLRILYNWPITIDTIAIPMSASILAFVAAVILALWMFAAGCKKSQ